MAYSSLCDSRLLPGRDYPVPPAGPASYNRTIDSIPAPEDRTVPMPKTSRTSCPRPGRLILVILGLMLVPAVARAGPCQGDRRGSRRISSSSSPTTTPTRRSAPTAIRAADRDAEHRPPGPRGDAVRPLPGAQLDLRAQPGHVLTGKYTHLNGFYNNTNSRFDGSQMTFPSCSRRRLPDGHDRQVAPGHRSHRLRLLAHPARPGGLLQPADDPQRHSGSSMPATSPTSSPT